MDYRTLTDYLEQNKVHYEINAKTSLLVSFRIGGTADFVIYPDKEGELTSVLKISRENGYKYAVLGNGTNSYFCDGNFGGAVIVTSRLNRIYTDGDMLVAQCGASLSECAKVAMENGLCGMEFVFGIPGSVGGAVCMNASAFGASVSDTLSESKVFDNEKNETYVLGAKEHDYGIKRSVFSENKNLAVIESKFRLCKGDKEAIRAKMSEFLIKRSTSQPLDFPSAGSVFKRPRGQFASKLIDEAGLKGLTLGGASVSEKHAGFIINTKDATAKDLRKLIDIIKIVVKQKSGADLEEEIIYME